MENKLIIGPAGCAKTTKLAQLYGQLINDGATIDDIAACSFNKRAADKIAIRVGEETGVSPSILRGKWCCTLHAVFLRLLKKEFNIRVLSPEAVAKEYCEFLYETTNIDNRENNNTVFKILITLYELYEEIQPKGNFQTFVLTRIQELHSAKWNIATAMRLMKKSNLLWSYPLFREMRMLQDPMRLTFQELQIMMLKHIDKFKNSFKYWLLDECQDLSPYSWRIINKMNAKKILIGDPMQSIYSFRGVSPELFLSLPYKREYLLKCWRYDTQYARGLEYGIASIFNESKRKDIIGVGKSIKVHYYMPHKITDGVVLARVNSVLHKFSYKLLNNFIPHIRQESTLLGQSTYNPFKKRFRHILVFLESKTIEELVENIKSIIRPKHYNDLSVKDKIEILKNKYKDYYDLFLIIKDKPIERKVRLCQYNEKLRKQALELMRVHDVEQFIESVKSPKILLCPVHSFKGCDADKIYILGWKDGLFPLLRKGDWREEARIAYVALSRVKREIYLDGYSSFTPRFLRKEVKNYGPTYL